MKTRKKPEVSIVIPVFNRKFELNRALNSIASQTFREFEVIVVDDFSDPPIQSTIDHIYKDLQIKTIRLPKKGNANIARNKGIEESKGNYIAFLDSDDEWRKNHLEFNLNFLKLNSLDGIYGGIDIIRPNKTVKVIPRNINENELFINYLFEGGLCSTPTLLIKSKCFEEIKFDETLLRHQDWDFGIRFHKLFNFKSINSSTVIVHWGKTNDRKIDLHSSKLFIQKHQNDISKRNYHIYHRNMYHSSKKLNSEKHIINYYKNNALKNFDELSITDFMSIFEPKSNVKKIYYYLIYFVNKLIHISD